MKLLSILIPAYNESRTIIQLLELVSNIPFPVDTEIIVIDDGSSDQTGQLVKKYLKGKQNISLVRHSNNKGKGAALKTGLDASRGDVILIQDADLEYTPSDILKLIRQYQNHNTVVYGSRNLLKNERVNHLYYWGGVLLSEIVNLFYGKKITDVCTCYKLIPRTLLESYQFPDDFSFCVSVTSHIYKNGQDILEVPISYRPRTRSQGKKITLLDGFKAIYTLFKLRISK